MDGSLTAFIGNRDPSWCDSGETIDGPILMTVHRGGFSKLHLLSSSPAHDVAGQKVAEAIRSKGMKISVSHKRCHVHDPSDFVTLFPLMESAAADIMRDSEGKLSVLVSSGTPQMATVWIYLHAWGSLNGATLLRAIEPRFNDGEFRLAKIEHPFGTAALSLLECDGNSLTPAQLLACRKTGDQLRAQMSEAGISPDFKPIIGKSKSILELKATAARIAGYDTRVLITGETGTGKELAARLVHAASTRGKGPFIPVNCAAMPAEVAESELFGHAKGSFTGAIRDHKGYFGLASGGTLFLDEVGDLSEAIQAKLLRVLETGEVRPVGSERTYQVDTRVVSATHRNLHDMVTEGKFREDLFYRLAILRLHMPPLRERPGDANLLAQSTLDRLNGRYGRRLRFDQSATAWIASHFWPGNVRELANAVEAAFVISEVPLITSGDLAAATLTPAAGQGPSLEIGTDGIDLDARLDQIARATCLKALEATKWNRAKAAELLGLKPHTFRKRLKSMGLAD